MSSETCQCCTFGNHTEPCTCNGDGCCHPMYVALLRELRTRASGNDNYPELLDAFEAEVLRKAAAKIRAHWYPRVPGDARLTQGVDAGMDKAADLIDPDKED